VQTPTLQCSRPTCTFGPSQGSTSDELPQAELHTREAPSTARLTTCTCTAQKELCNERDLTPLPIATALAATGSQLQPPFGQKLPHLVIEFPHSWAAAHTATSTPSGCAAVTAACGCCCRLLRLLLLLLQASKRLLLPRCGPTNVWQTLS
jgi:hypothetical protein